MICYHGTTRRRAQRICAEGFRPRKPSRRVWFAQGRGYALRRAKTQAKRTHDRAVVLTCDLNLPDLRRRLGKKRIFHSRGNIAIAAPLPVSVLRSYPVTVDQPTTPDELAAWVNHILGLKPWKGVGRRHEGIQRLSSWVAARLGSQPRQRIKPTELLPKARQWLPEFFEGVEIDPEHLRIVGRPATAQVALQASPPEKDDREDEAIACLESCAAKQRVRGLTILARLDAPDLSEWCAIFLDDDSVTVRESALRSMLRCDSDDVSAELIEPLARSENKRVRGAAIAALARHAGDDAPRWFKRGLKDPSPCVRMKTAALLDELDPAEHPAVFELALYDPNSHVARTARKLTAGRGVPGVRWPRPRRKPKETVHGR